MVLDISGGLFEQKDVRETPAASGVVNTITAGEGIDISGVGDIIISGELASTTNKGVAHFNANHFSVSMGGVSSRVSQGAGIDVSPTLVISGEDATVTNKGIASFNTDHFTVASGAVSIKKPNFGTFYWTCAGNAFIGDGQEGAELTRTINKLATSARNDVFISIDIPNGAIITGVMVYGSAGDGVVKLYRVTLSSGATSEMADTVFNSEDTSISNATVDSTTYAYCLLIDMLSSASEIYGARITYTL